MKNTALFDLDNTLVRTDRANFLAYRRAVSDVLGVKHACDLKAGRRFDKAELLRQLPFMSAADVLEVGRLKSVYVSELVDETALNQGIVDHLFKLVDMGGRAILVSNAARFRALDVLKHHGLLGYFASLFFGGEKGGFANKYDYAVASLGLSAGQLCVFDDDLVELKNAVSLGINHCVWVR